MNKNIKMFESTELLLILIAVISTMYLVVGVIILIQRMRKEFKIFIDERFPKPNVGAAIITKNTTLECPCCFKFFRIGITNKGNVAYIYTDKQYDDYMKKNFNSEGTYI